MNEEEECEKIIQRELRVLYTLQVAVEHMLFHVIVYKESPQMRRLQTHLEGLHREIIKMQDLLLLEGLLSQRKLAKIKKLVKKVHDNFVERGILLFPCM